nr:unnamed protein product [Callosobruchus chinensis]
MFDLVISTRCFAHSPYIPRLIAAPYISAFSASTDPTHYLHYKAEAIALVTDGDRALEYV